MKQDTFRKSLLFDYYGDLLTDKQKTCFELYYNQDFSLGEIAEQSGISRQGVHDCIARAEAALLLMEQKTGCIARAAALQRALTEIRRCTQELALSEDAQTRRLAMQLQAAADTLKE